MSWWFHGVRPWEESPEEPLTASRMADLYVTCPYYGPLLDHPHELRMTVRPEVQCCPAAVEAGYATG